MSPIALWINGAAFGAAFTTFYWLISIRCFRRNVEPEFQVVAEKCEICGQEGAVVHSSTEGDRSYEIRLCPDHLMEAHELRTMKEN